MKTVRNRGATQVAHTTMTTTMKDNRIFKPGEMLWAKRSDGKEFFFAVVSFSSDLSDNLLLCKIAPDDGKDSPFRIRIGYKFKETHFVAVCDCLQTVSKMALERTTTMGTINHRVMRNIRRAISAFIFQKQIKKGENSYETQEIPRQLLHLDLRDQV